jgi:hypothetical protein
MKAAKSEEIGENRHAAAEGEIIFFLPPSETVIGGMILAIARSGRLEFEQCKYRLESDCK